MICFCVLGTIYAATAAAAGVLEAHSVFEAGTGDYHTYRIPALVQTTRGTLLAFCEGRRDGQGDAGQIDTLLRRSADGGRTWDGARVVARAEGFTTGNPAPVVNAATGTVWLLLTRNRAEDTEREILAGTAAPRTVWVARSDDDGATWSAAREITASVSRPEWRWYATGPGHGIQLASGRLAIPCNHSLSPDVATWHSHMIYSDDGGATWQPGGTHAGRTNESTLVELRDGTLYQNMRNYRGTNRRAVARSGDGGATWSPAEDDPALLEPVCQASAARYPHGGGAAGDWILFSNPASRKREKMTVRLSRDGGATWPVAREVFAGPSAYSDVAALADGDIGLLFEQGLEGPYERITFARFPLAWLLGAGE